jgi:hypothetical protein
MTEHKHAPKKAPEPSVPPETKAPEPADGLRSIYTNPDGGMPDLSKLETAPNSRLRRTLMRVAIVLAAVSAAAWIGFFVWTRVLFQTPKTLDASIAGPSDVAAGEEVRYVIRYENAGREPISSLDLKVNLPLGFRENETVPPASDPDSLVWHLGTLTAGSDGEVEISGVFRAEVPSTQTLQAYFTYRPANFSSDFQLIKTFPVKVTESALRVAVNGPEKALPGDEVTYEFKVENGSATPVKDAELAVQFPTDFLVASATPAATSPDLPRWAIAEIQPGQLFVVTVKGRFSSSSVGEETVRASVSLLAADSIRLSQATDEAKTDVLGGNLAFHLVVNGNEDRLAANPGDSLLVSIDYANRGAERLSGVSFVLTAKGDKALPIDWSAATLAGGKREGTTVTWDEAAEPAFAALDPGTEGVIDVVLPLSETVDLAKAADAFTLSLSVNLKKVGSVESPRRLEATPFPVVVNSDFAADGFVRYFTEGGEALGTGPVPPKAGETTAYRIFWTVSNTMHALDGVRLSSTLPADVAWTGKTQSDIGTLAFNETTRVVTWDIPRLPVDVKAATASFEVAITPKASDAGSFLKLLNATAAEATDAVTKNRLARAIDALTTEAPRDEGVAGKGVVEP